MSRFIKMKIGQGETIVEVAEEEDDTTYRSLSDTAQEVVEKFDVALDKIIQDQIIGHCTLLEGAFSELKKHEIAPSKANAEFGLQFNGEGNVFVTKVGAQASFKVSFEWDLTK